MKQEVINLLKARSSVLWVQSLEERRAERVLAGAVGSVGYELVCWDCATGLSGVGGNTIDANARDVMQVIQRIRADKSKRVYVLRDVHRWFSSPMVIRGLRTLARELPETKVDEARAVILLTPPTEVPPELSACVAMVDFALPSRDEIGRILDAALKESREFLDRKAIQGSREDAIDAALGLTVDQIELCYARSIVEHRQIRPSLVASEKKRAIAAEKVVTWYDPDPRGLDAIGGLDLLKDWLIQRRTALSQEAREYGLPAPKGVLLVGVPGCGKSLTAKCVATAWGLPLLRLDLGALRSKWVGESEANIRKALKVAETLAPCVVWMDEIEKALAGAGSQASDGGIAADALGTILSWMQERVGSVFMVATANDVASMPPELLRKGRFDELFFVDLPSSDERKAILQTALQQHLDGRAPEIKWTRDLAEATEGFTGAEIAAMVPDAMFVAYADGARAITKTDLLHAAANVVPLSSTARDQVTRLREWARGRARPASAGQTSGRVGGRKLDL